MLCPPAARHSYHQPFCPYPLPPQVWCLARVHPLCARMIQCTHTTHLISTDQAMPSHPQLHFDLQCFQLHNAHLIHALPTLHFAPQTLRPRRTPTAQPAQSYSTAPQPHVHTYSSSCAVILYRPSTPRAHSQLNLLTVILYRPSAPRTNPQLNLCSHTLQTLSPRRTPTAQPVHSHTLQTLNTAQLLLSHTSSPSHIPHNNPLSATQPCPASLPVL